MFGYPYYMPPPYQQPPYSDRVSELIKELKTLKKMARKRPSMERKKKEEEDFIKVPKPKPKLFSTMQMMLILTALFPVIGPLYYLGVVTSWALLKAGMMTILGN